MEVCMYAQLLSQVQLLATPWTVARQAPLSKWFFRQEYWSGLPFPSPGDLPDPGIEPGSPTLQADFLPSEPPEKEGWSSWIHAKQLEKTLESPLDCKEIKPVNPKGNQSWIFIGRIDAEAEVPILWPPHEKNWLIGKDPDAGRDWGQEEKGTTEVEIVGWYHRLDAHDFEQALGVSVGQGSLVCCSLWGHKNLDMTESLNWTEQLFWNF